MNKEEIFERQFWFASTAWGLAAVIESENRIMSSFLNYFMSRYTSANRVFMKRHNQLLFFLMFLFLAAQSGRPDERFILRSSPATFEKIVAKYGLSVIKPPDLHSVAVVSLVDPKIKDSIAADLKAESEDNDIEDDKRIPFSELKKNAKLTQPVNALVDALAGRTPVSFFGGTAWNSYVNQPASQRTRLLDALRYFASGLGVIAVIDTGVDPSHPVIKSSLVPGYDFTRNIPGMGSELADLDQSTAAILDQSTAAILDRSWVVTLNQSTAAILDQSTAAILDTTLLPAAFGHGTMVAGIAHLAAPTAKIMSLKAFNADGTANTSDIVQAIYYAVDHDAKVINMSFSLEQPSIELAKAVNYATARGVICVASAGNGGQEAVVYPAAFHGVIGVVSTGSTDLRSPFSNYGTTVAVMAAPGEGIVAPYPGGNYAVVSGTSFAAPFISGAVNLTMQMDSTITPIEILYALSRKRKAAPDVGFGQIDFYKVLESVRH